MGLASGGNLEQQHRLMPFTAREIGRILQQMLQALKYLHVDFNMIHWDMKPANILRVLVKVTLKTAKMQTKDRMLMKKQNSSTRSLRGWWSHLEDLEALFFPSIPPKRRNSPPNVSVNVSSHWDKVQAYTHDTCGSK